MQRKFYGTKKKEDEIPSKTTEWHSKVAWKLIGKSASECRKPQLNMRGATSTREKSLRENPWKLFFVVVARHRKRPFFFVHMSSRATSREKNPKHYEGMSSVVNEDAICSHNLVALSIGLSAIKMACLNT